MPPLRAAAERELAERVLDERLLDERELEERERDAAAPDRLEDRDVERLERDDDGLLREVERFPPPERDDDPLRLL